MLLGNSWPPKTSLLTSFLNDWNLINFLSKFRPKKTEKVPQKTEKTRKKTEKSRKKPKKTEKTERYRKFQIWDWFFSGFFFGFFFGFFGLQPPQMDNLSKMQ